MNYIYPSCAHDNQIYSPIEINEENLQNIINNVKKITNCKCSEHIIQTEYIYKDLVKIECNNNNKESTNFFKKKIIGKYDKQSKDLIINYEIVNINDWNFPNLFQYDHVENKEIHKFKNVLFVKSNNNKYWNICVQFNNNESVNHLKNIKKLFY